jgi:hypothetical protein
MDRISPHAEFLEVAVPSKRSGEHVATDEVVISTD